MSASVFALDINVLKTIDRRTENIQKHVRVMKKTMNKTREEDTSKKECKKECQ